VFTKGKSDRLTYWIGKQATDTISIAYETKPDWVNVDPAKLMLWEKNNMQSETQWLMQAKLAANAMDKAEVLAYFTKNWKDSSAYYEALTTLLNDQYFGTRKGALTLLKSGNVELNPALISLVEKLAETEKDLPTRSVAIDVLGTVGNQQYKAMFQKGVTDSSYSVAGASLESLARLDAAAAMAATTPAVKEDAKGRLTNSLRIVNYLEKDTAQAAEVLADYRKLQFVEKLFETNGILYYANKLTNITDFRKVVGAAAEASKMLRSDFMGLQSSIRSTFIWMIRQREELLRKNPNNEIAKEQLKYLREKTGY
jgi:aminopeptidase N